METLAPPRKPAAFKGAGASAVIHNASIYRERLILGWAAKYAETALPLTVDAVERWLLNLGYVDPELARTCASRVAAHATHMRRDLDDGWEQIGDALTRAAENGFSDEGGA